MLLAVSASAQTHVFPATDTNNAFTGANTFTKLNIYTVATLPVAGIVPGTFAVISDGISASDCTVGGASSVSACIWTGSTWASFGGGGSGSLVPGTVGNVLKYSGTTTGGDAGYAATAVALKPVITNSVCYVTNTGNDSNDGLSLGTAKLSPYGCVVALPGGSATNFTAGAGTVFIYGGTDASLLIGGPTFAIDILGSNDIHTNNAITSCSRLTNVVTCTFGAAHHYSAGQLINVYNVTGGATSFNGSFTVASTPLTTTLTYAQTGGNESATGGAVLPLGFLKEGNGDLGFIGYGKHDSPNTPGWQTVVLQGIGTPSTSPHGAFQLSGTNFHYSSQGISWNSCIPGVIGYDSNFSPTTDEGAFSTYFNNTTFDVTFAGQIACGPALIVGPNVLWMELEHYETSALGITDYPISTVTRSGNSTAVVLSSGPPTGGFQVGDKITVVDVADTSFNSNVDTGVGGNNGPFTITSVTDAMHFSYGNLGSNTSSTGGSVGLDSDNDRRAGILINTGNGAGNSVDMFYRNGTMNDGGGVRAVGNQGTGTQVVLQDINMEGAGLSPPLFDALGSATPNVSIFDMQISDSGNQPCMVRIRRPFGSNAQPAYSQVNLGPGQQGIPVCGKANVLNGVLFGSNNGQVISDEPRTSPGAKGQTGSFSNSFSGANKYYGQVDDVRRGQIPVNVPFANLAASTCGSWSNVTGGALTITPGVTDVTYSATNACNLTMTVAGNGEADSLSSSQTIKAGDGYIAGIWFQASSNKSIPSYSNNTPLAISFASATTRGIGQNIYGPGQTLVASAPSYQEDGQWQWLMAWDSVNNAATTSAQTVKLQHFAPNTYPENLYGPMLLHIPISQISRYSISITSVTSGAGFAIYTLSGTHQFLLNQIACINDVTDTSYNGCGQIVKLPSATTIELKYSGSSTSSTGGTAYASADSEIAEIALAMTTYSNSCSVGQICNFSGPVTTATGFGSITPGTNTSAAMVLGTGSSLTVSGLGTNNATSLNGNTFANPGTIGTTPGIVNATQLNLPEGSAPSGISATDVFYGLSGIHWPGFNANSGGGRSVCGSTGTLTSGHLLAVNTTGTLCDLVDGGTGTGSGTVTNFSANTITTGTQNFATAGVTSPGVTPALTYTLANSPAHTVFANCNSGSAAPDYVALTEACLPAATVFTDANATFGAHNYSFAAATILKPPAAAGFASTANDLGLNTTTNNWQFWANGANKIGAMWNAAPTNGNCVKALVSASNVLLTDAACTGATLQTNSVNNTSQTALNFVNTTGANGIDFSNPGTSTESAIIANVIGSGNSIPAVTVTGPQIGDYLSYTSGTLITNVTPGIVVNAQTGTSYSVSCTAGTGDRGSLITFNNAAAIAVTVPSAATCPNGFYFNYRVIGAGAVTFTPTTSTVNGASTLLALSGQFGNFVSDNTNYQANRAGYASGTTGSIGGAIVGVGCDTGTVTIVGASTSMVPVAVASTSGAPGAGLTVSAQVTSANTVTVSVCAPLTLTPTSSTYFVRLQE